MQTIPVNLTAKGMAVSLQKKSLKWKDNNAPHTRITPFNMETWERRTWARRSQPKVSTDGGGENDGEYSKADHDHDLLLRSAKTQWQIIQRGTQRPSYGD